MRIDGEAQGVAMGGDGDLSTADDATTKKSSRKTDNTSPKPVAKDHANDMLRSIDDRVAKATDGVVPVTSDDLTRAQAIEQFKGTCEFGFDIVLKGGIDRASRSIDKSDVPKSDFMSTLISLAAAAALGSSAGGIAYKLTGQLTSKLEEKLLGDAVKDTIKAAMKSGSSVKPDTLDDLKEAYHRVLEDQLAVARLQFLKDWPTIDSRLRGLDTEKLRQVAAIELRSYAENMIQEAAVPLLVSWTNFLARAQHGAMQGWNSWERNGSKGAIPLAGASPDPTQSRGVDDPTGGNVDPSQMGWAVETGMNNHAHYGVLEVDVRDAVPLMLVPGTKLRLDHVGPKVREDLKALGKVRNLRVNKIIRVSAMQTNPPVTKHAILITADGYIRKYNLGNETEIHVPTGPAGPQWSSKVHECMGDLIAGKQTPDCYVDDDANGAAVTAVAEQVQELSLALLET